MSLNQLDNCPKCGQLFLRGAQNICRDCLKKVELEFELVRKFMRNRDNRNATIHELSEATGVSTSQIQSFIHQGRLSISDFPNMGYPCGGCGATIREDRFCKKCQDDFSKELKGFIGEEQKRREQEKYMIKDKGYYQRADD